MIKVMFYNHFPLATVWRALVGRQPSYIWGPRWRTKALSEYPPHIPSRFYLFFSCQIYTDGGMRQNVNVPILCRPQVSVFRTIWQYFDFFGETRMSFVVDAPWHIRFNFCCRGNTKDHHIFKIQKTTISSWQVGNWMIFSRTIPPSMELRFFLDSNLKSGKGTIERQGTVEAFWTISKSLFALLPPPLIRPTYCT